jgi:hypothetical protein
LVRRIPASTQNGTMSAVTTASPVFLRTVKTFFFSSAALLMIATMVNVTSSTAPMTNTVRNTRLMTEDFMRLVSRSLFSPSISTGEIPESM